MLLSKLLRSISVGKRSFPDFSGVQRGRYCRDCIYSMTDGVSTGDVSRYAFWGFFVSKGNAYQSLESVKPFAHGQILSKLDDASIKKVGRPI